MNIRIFCVAIGLMSAGTWAQVPLFKLWVTEVYGVNPDGTYTAKCGPDNCPTQALSGIARPGDLIQIDVMVEGWDASTDSGICDLGGEVCSVSAQDCALSHCTGAQTSGECTGDSDCSSPDTCDPDRCEKSPLVGAYQWTIDSSTFSNGGSGPGLAPAELACTTDGDCACPYTEVPGAFNDCADFAEINPAFCTCSEAQCFENVCDLRATAYIDFSIATNSVFAECVSTPFITLDIPDYQIGASCSGGDGGTSEERFRCTAGTRSICHVDADCPVGTCALVAMSPYYLGTLLLEVTGESCGLFMLDLLQDMDGDVPISTYLADDHGDLLPTPIVVPLTIDIIPDLPCQGDPCWIPPPYCFFGNCLGTPIDCGPDKTCWNGRCLACTFDDLMDVTWSDADPPASGPFDRPGNCAIDAREPHSIGDVDANEGWDRLVLTFACDPTDLADMLTAQSFPLQTHPVEVSPPAIVMYGFTADAIEQTITIQLDRSISPGFYTCISQRFTGVSTHWCAGYLPGDASQDGTSTGTDITTLINAINLAPGFDLPIYATDINRTGKTTARDILRLIDLLNGAGTFDAWIARSLPDCPSAP